MKKTFMMNPSRHHHKLYLNRFHRSQRQWSMVICIPKPTFDIKTDSASQPSVSRTKDKNQKMTPFQESLLHNFKIDDDPNRHFLLSFLPEMSKMSERQNFEFRMEIMKALNKVKYQIADQPTQSNWPRFSSPFSESHNSNQYIPSPINRGYNETNQYSQSNILNTFDET